MKAIIMDEEDVSKAEYRRGVEAGIRHVLKRLKLDLSEKQIVRIINRVVEDKKTTKN